MIRGLKPGARVADREGNEGAVVSMCGRGLNRTALVAWDGSGDPPEHWYVRNLYKPKARGHVRMTSIEVEAETGAQIVDLFDALKRSHEGSKG